MAKKGPAGLLTTEHLTRVLDALVASPKWAKAMASIRASEGLAFNWRAQSIAAMKDNDTSSVFFCEFRGAWDFWHNHAGRARTENIITYEATVRDQALNGIEHVVLGPDQKPVYRENPNYIGRDDDYVMLSEGCKPEEVKYHRLEHDAKGHPVPLTKIEQIPAPLRLRVLEQDRRYIERKEIDQQVSGEITVAKPLTRLPGEARPDVARLRQLAAMSPEQRREAIGASKVPLDEHGRRTLQVGTLPSGRDDNLPAITKPSPFAAPYQPPEAKQNPPNAPRPSYARPTTRLDKGEEIGHGRDTIPPGGMKMC